MHAVAASPRGLDTYHLLSKYNREIHSGELQDFDSSGGSKVREDMDCATPLYRIVALSLWRSSAHPPPLLRNEHYLSIPPLLLYLAHW